jgi:HTH-type transcriptional regulator/antitoxin HigA
MNMKIKVLKNREEYREALERLDEVFDAPVGSAEGDEAELISLLIADYEKRNYKIDPPDPVEAIRIRMEELDLKQSDLAELFGGRNRASEVLSKKRRLTLAMIRNLSQRLNLTVEQLSRAYQLNES